MVRGARIAVASLVAMIVLAGTAPGADINTRYREAADIFHRLREADPAPLTEWRRLGERFLAIHDTAPHHRRGADALYSAALAYRQAWQAGGEWNDLSRAAEVFRRFVADYPGDRLSDDSLMHLAHLQRKGFQNPKAARESYARVLSDYPRGDQAPAARGRLQALEKILAVQQAAAAADAERTSEPVAIDPGEGAPVVQPIAFKLDDAHATAMPADGPRRVKRVQVWSALAWTRVILSTDRGVPYRYNRLEARGDLPERVYFDLEGAEPSDALPADRPVKDAVLQRVRVNRHTAGVTRVVLDLKRIERLEVKDYVLPSEQKIVVDLYPQRASTGQKARVASAAAPAREVRVPAPLDDTGLDTLSLQASLGLKVRRIMLDPGHGGHDPGAVAHGLREKDLVLDIAHALRDILHREHPDIEVGMTRDDDSFIPLQERPELAKQFGADLFVSIHLNANPITRFHGVETYFLNLTSDGSALQVAARENATTEKRVSDLNAILFDLLRDTNIVESSRLAQTLQTSLVTSLRHEHGNVRDLGVKQAPFLVLMGAEMPSVLVEAGFLTNPTESKRLRRDAYLERVARGIYDGLRSYIEESNIVRSPQGTAAVASRNS